MRTIFISAVFFLLPSFALAAGFAKQSMFLSQATVTQGDTVFIYAVVTNDKTTTFTGTLKFTEGETAIGSAAVSLTPSEASTVSVSWKPAAGEHDVTATLVAGGDVVESEDSIFFVNSPPAPAASSTPSIVSDATSTAAASEVESSMPLEQWVSNTSPEAGKTTDPVFKAIDWARIAAVKKLDGGTNWAKQTLSTSATAPSGWQNTLWLILATAALYVFSALDYLVSNIGIFYPVFALIFFYILWRLYKLARRR